MKKYIKLFMLISTFILCITGTMQNLVYASDAMDGVTSSGGGYYEGRDPISGITDPISNPGAYDPTQKPVETTKVTSIVQILVRIITTIGVAVAMISLMVIGIRFMAGSIEDRAKYKETMMPYIVGAILVFSISGILQVLSNIFFKIGG